MPAANPELAVDWLDNDLSPILHFQGASLALRTTLVDVPTWGTLPDNVVPTRLDVFTDGSAYGQTEPLRSAPAGWAFTVWVVADGRSYFYGAACATAVPPGTCFHLGETDDTPLQGELLAICWALAWLVEFGGAFHLPCCLHYDCQAAGQGTFGVTAPPSVPTGDTGIGLSALAVILRQCAQRRVDLTGKYVPGHAGHLGNELSDCFARYARSYILPLEERVLPIWPAKLAAHPLATWAWLCAPADDMPTLFAFESTAGYLQVAPPIPRPPPVAGLLPATAQEDTTRLALICMTYNVLTLFDGQHASSKRSAQPTGLRLTGKRHLITEQCEAHGIHLLGLQETRLQETATLPDAKYILLHAAADERGHFGCALWLSKTIPYAWRGSDPLYFQDDHCTVAAFSPRHILVSVDAPAFACTVLVAHAPSDPSGNHGLATAFWKERTAELQRLPPHRDVILLVDANGRIGDHHSPAVGPSGAEPENPGGSALHDFVLQHSLCLPSTQEGTHEGEQWTWSSPTGVRHRIDYVAVPQDWMDFQLESWVWYSFEALQKRCDHVPVVLSSKFQQRPTRTENTAFRRRACRPNDLDSQLDREAFERELAAHPLPCWSVDVDTHFSLLTSVWINAGQAVQTPSLRRARQSYLSEDTLQWVRARKQLQCSLRAGRKETDRRRLLIGFAGFLLHWQGGCFTDNACRVADQWLVSVDHDMAQIWASFLYAGRFLRNAIRVDRNRYLEALTQDVRVSDLAHPKQLYQRVRKAFPKAASARRSKFVALPAVEMMDGNLAVTGEQRQHRWREHFAAQESGTATDAAAIPRR